MFGALSYGLPQLFLPLGADQFRNAAACQQVGAALTLQPSAFSGEAVTTSVRRPITEPAFTTAAQDVQTEIMTLPIAADALACLLTPEPPDRL